MNLDGFERPDPSDVPAFAAYWYRQRIGACLENYSFDTDTVDPPDWAGEIIAEAEEYHSRTPDSYLTFVAESYEAGRVARLQSDFQLVLDGVSLTGTGRAPRNNASEE